jgi:hypothetical protein
MLVTRQLEWSVFQYVCGKLGDADPEKRPTQIQFLWLVIRALPDWCKSSKGQVVSTGRTDFDIGSRMNKKNTMI